MNKQDRKEIAELVEILENAKGRVENLCDAEQEKFDNLSEGLQQSERGQKMEEDTATLTLVGENLDDAINSLNEI
jgi:hypothetical protein